MNQRRITIEMSEDAWAILDRLVSAHPYCDSMEGLVCELLDHVQQGVYRSGSWERGWLEQCIPFEAVEAAYKPQDDPLHRAL